MKIIIVADEKSLNKTDTGETCMQACYEMFSKDFAHKDIIVQCPQNIAEQIYPIVPDEVVSTEPEKKGTAPAVALATTRIYKENPNEIVAVAYSDHPVSHKDKLTSTLKIAEEFVKNSERIYLIGVNPTSAATQYGYAQIGKTVQEINGKLSFEMTDFKEKPDAKLANEFINSWRYLWNTGYMIAKASTLLNIYSETLPDIYKGVMTIKESLGSTIEKQIIETVYNNFEKISIDRGIYEKIDKQKVGIIPVDLAIGTF
jgi:mannose-1-phosphate guanylyltransferase